MRKNVFSRSKPNEKKLKVVTIGGGNGSFSLLSGLKSFDFDLSAIVAMTDDGGSTGRLRRELGVLPPGDVRYCLSALSTLPDPWEKIWNYRFEEGGLRGHTAGNILLAGLEKFHGDFIKGLREMEKLLLVQGKIIPATTSNVTLGVELLNKKVIEGQHKINIYEHLQKEGVKRIFIKPEARANPKAISSIKEADIILIGPGNVYCSLLPTLIIEKIKKAILKSKSLVIFNCNVLNRIDQTIGFDLDDYVKLINGYLGKNRIDVAIINNAKVSSKIKKCLSIKDEDLVKYNQSKKTGDYLVFEEDILENKFSNFSRADEISYLRSPLRHDGEKVGKVILRIWEKFRNFQ